jgi:ankyrin repeat protein
VWLQCVDLNVLFGEQLQGSEMPLQYLACRAHPSEYSTHENQLILAKQLIEHGANVNTVSNGETLLHIACSGRNVTNLDFIELLLEEGADPNAQNSIGYTLPRSW